MSKPTCIHCAKGVYLNHRAVECDSCGNWQHLLCGNTGISLVQYKAAVRDGSDLSFVCTNCSTTNEESMEQNLTEETINYSKSPTVMRVPSSGPLNSTRLSSDTGISSELSQDFHRFDSLSYESDSDFDVSRPEREVAMDIQEQSLADETVSDIPEDSPVRYELVSNGSQMGRKKLVSSNGYSFVFKRKSANGTIDWRCSVRHNGSGCLATIKELDGNYRVTGQNHNHSPKPGITTSVCLKSELKEVSKTKLFETASTIVRDVSQKHQTAEQPSDARPTPSSLTQLCNRMRKKLRPKDPNTLDFELDENFLNGLGETFH